MKMNKLFPVFFLLGTLLLSGGEEPLVIRFVRHGQPGVRGTDFTPADKAAWIKLGLTPMGRQQAERTGQFLKKEGIEWRTVIASPQERASETADIICGILGKTFTLEPDLREIGNPIRETLDALRKRFKNLAPDAVLDLTSQQRKGFRENNKQQGERGRRVIMGLFRKPVKGPVLLVTHGNFMYTTIREMTGKNSNPWNCGMAALKVWPDGRAELVKAVYPEALPADLITCNETYFRTNPWSYKFGPYPAPRPDPAELVNAEFRKFISGEKSSWRPGRGMSPVSFQIKDGKIILRGQQKKAGVYAPRIPLTEGKTYRCRIQARGQGTAVCRCLRRPYRVEMKLSGEEREYELKFIPKRNEPHFYAALEADPGSELVITGFTLDYGK